jgi:DNA replication licensing factor MCM6
MPRSIDVILRGEIVD